MRKYQWMVALCAAAVLSIGVAACGSSSSRSSSSTGSSGGSASLSTGSSASAPSGAPITIGMVCTCSGPQGSANGPSAKVAQAWEQATNANGGLNGHPVKVIVADDGGSASQSALAVKKLVEGDKVMAIAGENSLADAAWQSYVEQKKIPVVGGLPYESTMFSSPVFLPSGAALPAEFYGMIAAAKQAGLTKIGAFYCAEAPTCALVPLLMGAIGSKVVGGVNLVNSQKIVATSPNFTAPCLAAKAAGVQAVFTAESPAISVRILAGCAQQGYKPKLIGLGGVLPVAAPATGLYEGAIVSHGNLPPDNTGTPGAQALHAALDKYAPGITKDANWSSNPLDTWMGLALFAKAAEAGKLTPSSTPADVFKAVYSLKNETLDGLAGPLNYTPGQPALEACPFVETIKGGQWSTLGGTKPQCVPPAKVVQLVAILKAAAGH